MFAVRRSCEIRWASGLDTYSCFIDLQKTFDSVDRPRLFQLLRRSGFPAQIIGLVRELHTDTRCKIRHDGVTTDSFKVKTGVRQGCACTDSDQHVH